MKEEEKSVGGKITGLVAAVGTWTQSYWPFRGPGENCPPEDGLGEASLLRLPSWVAPEAENFPQNCHMLCMEVDKVGPFPVLREVWGETEDSGKTVNGVKVAQNCCPQLQQESEVTRAQEAPA